MEYTRKQLSMIIPKLSQRQILLYTEAGIVTPEINLGIGRGRSRLYSDHNLFQFRIISGLSQWGIPIGKIREIIAYLDRLDVRKQYEKYHAMDADSNMYVIIFLEDNGSIRALWRSTSELPENFKKESVLNTKEISQIDQVIVINYGRIASGKL